MTLLAGARPEYDAHARDILGVRTCARWDRKRKHARSPVGGGIAVSELQTSFNGKKWRKAAVYILLGTAVYTVPVKPEGNPGAADRAVFA